MMYNNHKQKRNNLSILLQLVFVLCLVMNQIKTDLPVHCMLKDVQGKWDFTISTSTFKPDLDNQEQVSCGHGVPNKVSDLLDDSDLKIPYSQKITLDLRPNFRVFEDGHEVGAWSLIYDQSLIIKKGSAVFTAPFKYYKRQGSEQAESNCSKTFLGWYIPRDYELQENWSCFYGERKSEGEKKTQNYGFLQLGSNPKERENNLGEYLDKNIANELKKATANISKDKDEFGFSFIQTGITNKKLIENNLKYEQMGKVVEKINKMNLGWEADIHAKYIGMSLMQVKNQLGLNKGNYRKNKSDKFSFMQLENSSSKDMTMESIDKYILSVEKEIGELENPKGTNFSQTNAKEAENAKQKSSSKLRNKEKEDEKTCANCVPKIPTDPSNPTKQEKTAPDSERDPDSQSVSSYADISKYINSDIDSIDETKLSKNWDWRNVGGKSYLPPVRNQGNCGSCYVFSTMTALEARLRIQTDNQDKTLFSKQFALSCNFYSEGCDGGFPVLVGKFSKEFELVPEDCFKYTETNTSCKDVCDYKSNPKKYSVSSYGYLGGAYGKTNEAQMMKELRARGPIPGNMLVHWSFQYYKRGIFSKQPLQQNSEKINLKTLFDYGISWAKVEHSITLVGYGEENGTKYWIGMNTWGADWGDNGFFKILRGQNEAEIESMGDYFNVKVESRK